MAGLGQRECPLLRELLKPVLEQLIKTVLDGCQQQGQALLDSGLDVKVRSDGITWKQPTTAVAEATES